MAANRAVAPDTTPGHSVHAVLVRAGVVVAMLAVAVAIVAFTRGRFAAVGVPLLLVAAAWLLREAWHLGSDRRALARTRAGQAPVPGRWVAVEGSAVALEQPMRAPLSGRSALACRYEVREQQRGAPRADMSRRASFRPLRYEGFHLVASAIDGRHGRVRLRAMPDLIDLQATGVSGGLAPDGVTPSAGPRLLRFAVRAGLLEQSRDRVHVDWRYGADEASGRCESREWALEPGATVCAFGRFGDGELLPARSRPRGIPLREGPAEKVLPTLRGQARVYLAMGMLALVCAAVVVWSVL